jgi:hypothetical protein
LLLIFLSIGVNYLIFRNFNLSWSSVGFKEGSWFFQGEEFVRELLPLVALITMASIVAYFAVTSAVRRYKAYLDSGHDYRRLISAIEKTDDLDGENFARRLGKYPELRKFLTSVRDQIHRKEKELEDREKKLKKRAGDDGFNEKFEKECRTLAEAASDLIRGEVDEDLHITSPGLARIEENLRSFSSEGQTQPEGAVKEQIGEVIDELRQAGDMLRNRLSESSIELEASCSAARELEEQLSGISTSFENADDATPNAAEHVDLDMLRQSLKTMQQLCNELSEVGEESKSVAISTALRAGAGEVMVDDMIRLAEDVRKVALKYIDLSQSFAEATDRMHAGVDKIESESGRLKQLSAANADLVDSIGALRNKMSLWVERIIVLNDHLQNAEEVIDLSLVPIDEKLSTLTGESGGDFEEDKANEMGLGDGLPANADQDEVSENDFELETVDSCAFDGASPLAFDLPDTGEESQDIPGIEKNPEHIFSQRGEDGEEESCAEEQAGVEPATHLAAEAGFEELPPEAEDIHHGPEASPGEDGGERVDSVGCDVASEDQNRRAPIPRDSGYTAEKLEGQVTFGLTDDGINGDEVIGSSLDVLDETSNVMEEAAPAGDFPASHENSGDSIGEDDTAGDEKVIDLYSLGAVDIG